MRVCIPVTQFFLIAAVLEPANPRLANSTPQSWKSMVPALTFSAKVALLMHWHGGGIPHHLPAPPNLVLPRHFVGSIPFGKNMPSEHCPVGHMQPLQSPHGASSYVGQLVGALVGEAVGALVGEGPHKLPYSSWPGSQQTL